ncbi:N,N'-diacetylchitobiose phosphorylase [compost metagenome]
MSAKHEEKPGTGGGELLRPEIRTITSPATKDRELVLLSNGHYSLMMTATGSGYSRWNGLSVSRWRPDPTEDRWGQFIFLRDTATNDWWSTTTEPRRAEGEQSKAVFGDEKAEFHKTVGDLTSTVEVIVGTEHDAEGRRVTLLNMGTEDRFIEVTSYMEPVIAGDDGDNGHPVFSRMFINTEIGKRGDVIRAWRNKRDHSEPDMLVAHLAADHAGTDRPTEYETDRRKFLGRGRTLSEAAAFDPGASLSNTDGFTLDPIMSLRRSVRVPAGKKVSVVFWTIAAPKREDLDKAIEHYRHAESFQSELTQAWTRTQMQMRHLGVTSQDAAVFQHLARYLVYPDMQLRADQQTLQAGMQKQSGLWPSSVSGDLPIFTLRINDEADMPVAKEAILAQQYLRSRGVVSDLVIFNERGADDAQDMQQSIEQMATRMGQEGGRTHVFTLRRDLLEGAGADGLIAASRVVLHARNGQFGDQLNRTSTIFAPSTEQQIDADRRPLLNGEIFAAPEVLPKEPTDLEFWNGIGGFSEEGNEYVVRLNGGQSTPHPWINVISNDTFGFHVSAEGAGFSWAENSRDYQLTPWTNDLVINRPGEGFYVSDTETNKVYTPFAALSRRPEVLFEARHGLGYSVFSSEEDGLKLELTQTVDRTRHAKFSHIKLKNSGSEPKKLKLYGYVEWLLGANTAKTVPFILPSRDEATGTLFANNAFSINFSRFAFLGMSEMPTGFTASRREFVGRFGSVQMPAAVAGVSSLSGSLDLDGDPCAALAYDVELAPGQETEVTFFLGDAATKEEAVALSAELKTVRFDGALAENRGFWNEFTGRLKISTPDKSLDNMVNHWLPYQALGCRIMARTAFYQASGAFGFRDQLQDTLAFLVHEPSLARRQIINAASRQFKEGDVMHWWLPHNGSGVRTTISDDVVWLAYAINQYVSVTGDQTILGEQLPFLSGPILEKTKHDAFIQPEVTNEIADLYEHAARALDLAIDRTGDMGLPLMLGGDWNDGMNRVGVAGRGMSVWLGWFLAAALRDFIPYAEARKDKKRVDRWKKHIDTLKDALETDGWDGDYYRRGYFDDGTPLGSAKSDECRIDSLGQSWSVLSGEGRVDRRDQAMDAVMKQLVDEEAGIIRLFTPPFEKTRQDPGYIKAYPPGVRENGGQYTHAAIWVVLALAQMKRGDDAWKCFQILNPINHALNRDAAETYRVEPYVVAADVYGAGDYQSRGGWTWYTGSAGWLYRAAIEGILGIKRNGDRLTVDPSLPTGWDGFEAELTIEGKAHKIKVEGGNVTVDGNSAGKDGGFLLSSK